MDTLFYTDAQNNVPMLKNCVFSFVANGSSDPDATLNRGNYIASALYSTTGTHIVTLTGGFYRLDDVEAMIDADSSGGGAYATVYCPDEQANPLVLHVFTHAADGTKTNYTGRRVRLTIQASDADFQ